MPCAVHAPSNISLLLLKSKVNALKMQAFPQTHSMTLGKSPTLSACQFSTYSEHGYTNLLHGVGGEHCPALKRDAFSAPGMKTR